VQKDELAAEKFEVEKEGEEGRKSSLILRSGRGVTRRSHTELEDETSSREVKKRSRSNNP
jgi:hypothetical protein